MKMNSTIVVTGGAGFIGSHIVDRLIKENYNVIVIDNLSSGSFKNISSYAGKSCFNFVKADLKITDNKWKRLFENTRAVFHFAANPEVRLSVIEPEIHFRENVITTFNVLEACRKNDVPQFIFASSSTVYGEPKILPTREDYSPLQPISIYGAYKLACENIIQTYSRLYGFSSLILRYANVVGPRSAHGVIIDFIKKLRNNPSELEILGDGSQKKSYLYVNDAVDATLFLFNKLNESNEKCMIFNIGNEDWINVCEIAKIIVSEMGLKDVKFSFKPATNDGRGWPGDIKHMLLDISKIKKLGWKPTLTSNEAIRLTAKYLLNSQNNM